MALGLVILAVGLILLYLGYHGTSLTDFVASFKSPPNE